MRRVFTINRSTTKMPRECAAVGCAELQTKGSLFSFHTFPKDSSRRKLHPWRFELEIVPSRLPCGHPHRHANKKQMDMVNTERRKEKQEVQLLNYKQIPLPCLKNKTKARQKINENNREKSKIRKVNRNSAGLCTNE